MDEKNNDQSFDNNDDNEIKHIDKEELEKKAKAKLKKKRPEYKKKRVVIPAISALVLILTGILLAVHSTFYQSTDDAFVEGHIISIAPRVAGQVINLYVDDNQEVKQNQILVEIDPTDYQVALAQAQAKLAEAKAKLGVIEKQVDENSSKVDFTVQELNSTASKLDFAEKDYTRYAEMYKEGIVSKQEYDKSLNSLTVAQANKKAADENNKAARASLEANKAKIASQEAEIKRLEAEVKQAEINLSYTKIYAPEDGKISARTVEKGNYVQIAQPMLSLVPQRVWVVANFKEIQLTNMKPGQKVWIKVDTYPHKRFKGHVDSIQRATGAKSSLFPPENAVGSYVKIVQRVPVKILFDDNLEGYNIVPGMSVVPKVKIK
ncbi:HlyD family secretion protein [bacterium]|uniref:HlyD family secretion protein n=1 Tax=Candidatus Scatenecus faecavium TaxID=2840915 RepID=A0A9D1K455_9BACT|nr:HlyD family secretion protein [bacterium]HIS83620.1 HlyD family secretion protein [Candidatus Scatenecus faecavium]